MVTYLLQREQGSAISASIQAAHSDFLINAVPYTLNDCLASTSFTGSITYNTNDNNATAIGDICSNATGTAIILNYKRKPFKWDYIPRNGNTPAYLVLCHRSNDEYNFLNLILTSSVVNRQFISTGCSFRFMSRQCNVDVVLVADRDSYFP
jgi:hypothetical protein